MNMKKEFVRGFVKLIIHGPYPEEGKSRWAIDITDDVYMFSDDYFLDSKYDSNIAENEKESVISEIIRLSERKSNNNTYGNQYILERKKFLLEGFHEFFKSSTTT